MGKAEAIRVALIEDEKEVRQGLSYILNHTEGYACVGDFRTYEDAFALLTEPPDVLLSDIGLPGVSGIEGARAFKERFPSTAIVMLTVYRDDDRIFRSIWAGATGYILKKEPPGRILEAIREVHAGGASMSSETARQVLEAFRKVIPDPAEPHVLTKREEEILHEIIQGNSYNTIADHLFLSVHTVRFHIRSIYEKLHVHSKSQAVAKALKGKIV